MADANAGSRGTKDILTRFPEEVGIEPGQRHEGTEIALIPRINNTDKEEQRGLNN